MVAALAGADMGVPFPNLYDPERRRIKHEQQNAYSKIAELWAQT
jgi:hypothetical protein